MVSRSDQQLQKNRVTLGQRCVRGDMNRACGTAQNGRGRFPGGDATLEVAGGWAGRCYTGNTMRELKEQ